MSDVNKTVSVRFKADVTPLERGIKQIPHVTKKEMREAIQSVDRQLKKAERSADRTARKMRKSFNEAAKSAGMVGAAVAGAGLAVVAFGQKIADLTNDLADTSTKTGIAVETLAGLRLAAEGSGLAFEQFIGPLQRLQRHMLEATKGTKLSVELFEDLGIQVTDSQGKLRSADAVFREMLKSLNNLESPVRRNAMLMEAFGKSGAMLAQSGVVQDLEKFVDLSRTFGVDTGPKALKSAADFQRSMADLGVVATGSMQSILNTFTGGHGLGPTIDFITEKIIIFEAIFKTRFAQMSIPVTILQGELYSLFVLITDGFDAAKAAMQATGDEIQKDLSTINYSMAIAEEKIKSLRLQRELIRKEQDKQTPQTAVQDQGTKNAQEEKKAVEKLTEVRRTDLKALEEFIRAQEKLRATQRDLASDRLSEEQVIRKAHNERIKEFDEQIDKVNRRYSEEMNLLYKLFDEKKITEEEGMARALEMEKEVNATIEQMRLAEMSSTAKMYRELDELREESANKEIERQREIAQATKEAFIDSSLSIMGSVTTIQENNLEHMKNAMEESIKMIEEQEKQGLITSKDAASQRTEIEEEYQSRLEEQQMKIYNMKKATAIAAILIDAAQAAARALADYPYPASLGIAALSGAAAFAQIEAVNSAPAPTFDMGGMIGNNDSKRPDERFVRALEGEAILDRATVQSLGGEQGIRNLQNGKGGESVIVIQPFKHFDKFMKTKNRRRKRTGRGDY